MIPGDYYGHGHGHEHGIQRQLVFLQILGHGYGASTPIYMHTQTHVEMQKHTTLLP